MQGDGSLEQAPYDPEDSRALTLYDPQNDEQLPRTATMAQMDMSTDDVPEALRRHLAKQLLENQQQFLSITIPERAEPLVFNGDTVITIGRRDDSMGINPSVDFTDLQGVQMGVSRRHAEISAHDGQFFIKDLQSANGTWVNDLHLVSGQYYHLRNGDQVRFGRITCTIMLHKSMTKTLRSVETSVDVRLHRLTLKAKNNALESDPAHDGVHVAALTEMAAYLDLLKQIQNILRAANGKPEYPLTLRAMSYERDTKTLVMDLYTSAQIIEIIKKDLPAAAEKIKTDTSDLEAADISTGLATLILEGHTLEADARTTFTTQLATAFEQLLSSSFEPVS